nr:hypothetical protein [Tanacetum cinerariifolium]
RERRLPPAPDRLRAGRPGHPVAGHADRRTVEPEARAGGRLLPAQGSPARRDPPAHRRQVGRQAVDRPRFRRRQPDPDRQPPDR